MALLERRGAYADFDRNKMLPGEPAVVLEGNPDSEDGTAPYICTGPGKVKRLATYDEMAQGIGEAKSSSENAVFAAQQAASQAEAATKNAAEAVAASNNALKEASSAVGHAQSAESAAEAARKDAGTAVSTARTARGEASDALSRAQNAQASVGNALEEVYMMKGDVDTLNGSQEEMALILSGKVDGAFEEDGYLYLTSNDEVVVGPLGPFAGGSGGGGGTGGNNATLSVQNTTGWISKTIAHGAECAVSITWSSMEDGMPTGNGSLKVTVNGALKATMNVAQGEVQVSLSGYLNVGSNAVKINVSDVYGNNRTVNFSITAVSVSLTSNFDASSPFTGAVNFTYIPEGNAAKTVHFILDGREIGTYTTSVSGRQQSYVIPAQAHGAHSLEVYFTAVIGGEGVESNHLYYELICITEGEETPIIVSSFNKKEVSQYTSVIIPYIVYNPMGLTADVRLLANGAQVASLSVDRTEQAWTYRADTAGQLTLSIQSGHAAKNIILDVKEASIDIEAETEGLSLFLSSYGRSNNEENPGVWEYGGISAGFTGFNFTSDGWQKDGSGISILRVSGDARLHIPVQVFAQDFRATGKTIEVEFATRDIMDYDAVVVSCMSGGKGMQLTAQEALLASEQSRISTQYKENEHVRIAFVVEKRSENRLVYTYINGVMSGAVQYPTDDDFQQASPVGISIGSNLCTVDLYCIRLYDNSLTRFQVLDNWIADTQDGEQMLRRYTHNDVFDAYGKVVISKLPQDLPYLVLEAPELPQYKGDKKAVSGYYVDPANASKSFSFEDAQADVQGTSSQYYARKNYKIKFKGGFTMASTGATAEKYAMNASAIPADTFTFKADVASSEGANNVELVRLYNDSCPYKTPPQVENPHIRQGIDGFPIVIFWYDGKDTAFIGKYNFNNDKGTEEVFGFAGGDESWEIKNNTSDRVLFKSADFNGAEWLNDFEGRYPDGNGDPENLAALSAWIVSTDQDAATGQALPGPVSYDGASYTADTAAYRLAKFKAELASHMEVDAVIFNYIFTELFLMVDNRAKNAFPTIYDGGKWLILPYDYDTAIGTNNEGALVFSYELEDIDQTASGADVFNGQQSTLWVNLRQAFSPQIQAMYQQLRSTGVLSYADTEQRFELHQGKWPEAIFNEDSYFKYLQPLIDDNSAAYLSMLQGSKAEQRKWWLYNRFRYIDSKYNAGDALSDVITVRGYAKADITVRPYADIYASVKFGSYLVQERALRGSSYTLECPLDNVNDTEIYIYSASQLASVGDLSGLMVGYAEFSMAVNLQSLKLGDGSLSYSNNNLTALYLGNNVLLRTLDVRNCPSLTQAVDISGCANIEYVYFDGTSITGVSLPNGGILKELHLPGTITNLTIRNQKAITSLDIPSYSNISTLRLENVGGSVDTREILEGIPGNSRVRILGFAWDAESAEEIFSLYDLLDTMRGLDENGNNMDKAQMGGTIHVGALTGAELAQMLGRYPNINVTYDHITSYLYYYNYDGTELLYTESIYDGGDGTYDRKPARPSTAQYTYTFAGWSKKPNGAADATAQKAVSADRNIYAAYTATVRKYTVYFYNGSTLLQKVRDVAYGSSAAYSGNTADLVDPAGTGMPFEAWVPAPTNIQGNTSCYATYKSAVEVKEIEDSWDTIIANVENGTYRSKYMVGNYKPLDLGAEGIVNMQIVAFDKDQKADGSGTVPISWLSVELLKTSKRFNPNRAITTHPETKPGWIQDESGVWSSNICGWQSGSATIRWSINPVSDGTIIIRHKTDSEGTDKLSIKAGSKTIVSAYGGTGRPWVEYELAVTGGESITIEATYKKDSSLNAGSDKAYVEIILPLGANVSVENRDYNMVIFDGCKEGTGTIGGWEKSELRAYMKETIKPFIPENVRNAIKEVTKTQPAYDTQSESYTQTTVDDVWIPSYSEMFGNYSSDGIYRSLFADNASRVKKKVGATSASWWWLRTAGNSYVAHAVDPSGSNRYINVPNSESVPLGFST